ncbi:MAG: hypothetical protein AAF741_18180 [Bacteroidota bacterium]
MPAKKKYLSSPGQRVLKITAGILGGYMLTSGIHLAIGAHLEEKGALIITSAYTSFFVWIGLMIAAFYFKNGWPAWGTYLLATAVCAGIIYLGMS